VEDELEMHSCNLISPPKSGSPDSHEQNGAGEQGERRVTYISIGWRACLPGILLLVAACASVPDDLGHSDVDQMLAERGIQVPVTVSTAETEELLANLVSKPLTPESAVRIAMLNNPELEAVYAQLGFGAADVYEAGRIRNPVFSFSLLNPSLAGEQDQLTLGLAASFTDLITLKSRKRLSENVFAALKQSVGDQVLHIAAETAIAYYGYVSAQQVAALRWQTAKAAELSATLAGRYFDAGNINGRELAMERAEASEARLTALEADAEAIKARTALAGMLGLSVAANWTAPAQLQYPDSEQEDLKALLELARNSRLDLAAARAEADVLADSLGVVNWTRWLGDLEVGYERERETDGERLSGPSLAWEIPIFNTNQDQLLRANADLQIAIAEVRRLTIAVDNDVRLAHNSVNNTKARVTEYRDVLIPQRLETVDQAQREVNYMLIGVFELISLKRDEYDTYQDYLESIRNYWVSRVELSLAAGNELPMTGAAKSTVIDVQEFISSQEPEMDHGMHGSMDHGTLESMDKPTPKSMDKGMDEPMNHSKHDAMEDMDNGERP
jgi:cobalt-zinc-cadmium efflux system outer membrane protein